MRVRDIAIKPGAAWDAVSKEIDAALRDVRAVINGGFRLRDQVRVLRNVSIIVAELPITVEIPAGMVPIGVQVVRAVEQGTTSGAVLSGIPVQWDAQAGAVRLRDFGGALGAGAYDLTIWIQE